MVNLKRSLENPILFGQSENAWEAEGAFNGCPVQVGKKTHLLYRAQSSAMLHQGAFMEVSTIGRSTSKDGIHFEKHEKFIEPELDWEKFGCEDPRVVKLGNKYYIFYTALSTYPFGPEGISLGLAISRDMKKIDQKHHVTPFNSKAMAIFPEKIGGRIVGILTANTDRPPSKIGLAFFGKESDMWSTDFWNRWYTDLDSHSLPLQRTPEDHIELGAPPIKTKKGWLLIYSYIKDYTQSSRTFGIEAILLDLKNPAKILGRTDLPLMVPQEEYELYGKVPNVVFPSGSLVKGKQLFIYYGAADTTCCLASCQLDSLVNELLQKKEDRIGFERFESNPILAPIKSHAWEAKAVFNPAALREKGRVYILYRAMSNEDTSVLGYAGSQDGKTIDERLDQPVYVPREDFEMKKSLGNSGCEDPRLTKIGNRIFMCYTAVDAKSSPRVALTSIKSADFMAKKWEWTKPKLISPAQVDDKDACILPEKINGKYVIFHRIQPSIDISFFDDLKFKNGEILYQNPILLPRKGMWDSKKIGINTVPIKTRYGWLMLYHGVSQEDEAYRVGAALLDLHDPEKVVARTKYPVLEPETIQEKEGIVPNVVFPCGMVKIKAELFIYYGEADKVTGGATIKLNDLLKNLRD